VGNETPFSKVIPERSEVGQAFRILVFFSSYSFLRDLGRGRTLKLARIVHSIRSHKGWRCPHQRRLRNWILVLRLRLLISFHRRSQDCKLEFVSQCVRLFTGRTYSKLRPRHREVGDRTGHQKFEPVPNHQNMRGQ
jgi:hypothetical protein